METSLTRYLVHGVFFLIYATIYLLWTGIHYGAGLTDCDGNRYIYAALDWGRPTATSRLAALILLFVTPILNFAFWGCFFRRARSVEESRRGASAGNKVADENL